MKPKSRSFLPLFFLSGMLACPGTAGAAVVTLGPVADAFVTTGPSNNLSANNYGGAGAMGVAGPSTTSARGEFRSVMRFNVADAVADFDSQFGAGGWTITGVTLQLTTAPTNNAIFNANASGLFAIQWMENDTWSEGSGSPMTPGSDGITYAGLPSLASLADTSLGTFNFTNLTSGTSNVWNLSLAPAFTSDLMAGGDVGLRFSAVDAGMSYLFHSRSFGTEASRPVLAITAVAIPEPACAVLLTLVAGTGFLGRRRR